LPRTVERHARIRGRREEDYLRVLYELKTGKGVIRVKDVASMLGVRPASVVDYLERLRDKGLVVYRKRGVLDLTEKGLERARRLYERHKALREFLSTLLGVDEEEADEAACLMEHGLSEKLLRRVELFMEFVKTCREGLPRFLEHLYYYYRTGERPPECLGSCPAEKNTFSKGPGKE
jgi:DtxR family Mn-dependent transcriptional regulator